MDLAARVLDRLGLVQNQQVEFLARQLLLIAGQGRVGGEHDVAVEDSPPELVALGSVQGQHGEGRGEPGELAPPVAHQAGGRDHQDRSIQTPGLLLGDDVSDGLQGLSQAHVVGENSARADRAKVLEPGHALSLVRAQIRAEARGQDRFFLGFGRASPQSEAQGHRLCGSLPPQRRCAVGSSGGGGETRVQLTQGAGSQRGKPESLIVADLRLIELAQNLEQDAQAGRG